MNINVFKQDIKTMKAISAELRVLNEMYNFPYQFTVFSKTQNSKGETQEPHIIQWKEKAKSELKEVDSEFLEKFIERTDKINEAYSVMKELQDKFYKETYEHLKPLVDKRNEIGMKLALPYLKPIKENLYKLPNKRKMEIEHIWLDENGDGLFLVLHGSYYNGKIKNQKQSHAYIPIE